MFEDSQLELILTWSCDLYFCSFCL